MYRNTREGRATRRGRVSAGTTDRAQIRSRKFNPSVRSGAADESTDMCWLLSNGQALALPRRTRLVL
jgi:hypothetical protein